MRPSRAPSRALVVYLDSQDYSRMASESSEANSFSALRAGLRKLVSEGRIEVRYSAIHISEVSHTSPAAIRYSAQRSEVLKELSVGKCMRFWSDILTDEILYSLDKISDVDVLREDHRWFDFDEIQLGNFLERLKSSLQSSLRDKGLNRKARRAARTINLARLITQTPRGIAALDEIAARLNNKFPLDRTIDRSALISYVTGEMESRAFHSYLHGLLADPVNLITRVAPEYDQTLRLPAVVRDVGQILIDQVNPAVSNISRHFDSLPVGPAFEALRESARTLPKSVMRSARRKAIKQVLSDRALDIPIDEHLDAMELPTIDVFFGALTKHLQNAVSSAEAGRSFAHFKKTDAGDLLHATYLPYVDIFRTDTAWSDLLKPYGRKYRTRVVGRVEDLLPEVERALAENNSSNPS